MTSLGPANALLQKDINEASPAKRTMSKKEKKREKTTQNTYRQTFHGAILDKRPNTSYLLQSAAERMPWPKQPKGRQQINPLTPVKAFTFKSEKESQFLHSEKDFKLTTENFPEDYVRNQQSKIDEVDEFDREEENMKDEINSEVNGALEDSLRKSRRSLKPKNPTISDVIKILQNEPKETGQYFYLIQPEESGPYDLQPILELEDHNKLINYKKFYTLSSKGITTYLNNEPMEFITLNDWINDKKNYSKIRRKTFF
jgi:hypothetical protein